MYATGVEPSMLCSLTSYSTIPRFKCPAVEFGVKPIKALSQSTAFDKDDDDSVENQTCKSHGRRTVALMSTISFLFPPHISNEAFGATVEDEFQLIQGEVRKVLSKGKAPGVLRLVFHDAGTFESDKDIGGMNGSIVYELDRPENGGLKKPVKILEKAKSEVNMIQKVSWADMIAVAGAEAVSLCGGPNIPVQLGRIDSMVPDPEGKLPAESLDASSMKQCFQRKGFSNMEGGAGSSAASNTNTTTGSMTASLDILKRKSSDVGWEYGELVNPSNFDKVKCKLCNKTCSGGIYRLKQHVASIVGNITACPKASPLDKQRCKDAKEGSKKKKQVRKEHIGKIREEVQVVEDDDFAENEISGPTKKPSKMHGPMDFHTSNIDPESTMEARKKMRQQSIHGLLFKNKTLEVHAYLARWIYEAGVPFHVINNDSYHRFCEAVGQFGPGYPPLSQYHLREPLLQQEVERTKESMKKQEEEWEKSGCLIMMDAWTDRKRSIMNICVNCKIGTSFVFSIEDSNEVHTGQYIFDYVDKHIEEIGPNKVVQVVTDNASNNIAASKLLEEKRPNIF